MANKAMRESYENILPTVHNCLNYLFVCVQLKVVQLQIAHWLYKVFVGNGFSYSASALDRYFIVISDKWGNPTGYTKEEDQITVKNT